jgi:GTP-binding protein HflX
LELFDRQKAAVGQGERTLLVYIDLPTNRHIQNGADEFGELAKSSGLNVVQNLRVSRNNVNAKYFIGSGKVEEIVALVKEKSLKFKV